MSKKTFNEKNIGVTLNRLHQWDKTSYNIFLPQIEINWRNAVFDSKFGGISVFLFA